MNKQQMRKISEYLSILKDQPLRFVFRALDMICFEFGEIITKNVMGRDAAGKGTLVKEKAGRIALHIQCYFRLSCGDKVLLAKGDLYQPHSKLESDPEYNEDQFDWTLKDHNRFDELSKTLVNNETVCIVQKVMLSRLGDVKITFDNDFVLEVLLDVSGAEECWRLFEAESDFHLIMTGQGVEQEE